MKRPGFERIKRRTHLRLSLEHLEHRRLMAGLNVYVFTDQDGSRSLTPSVDAPASNRLVYVDLNRDLHYQEGEPLAVSGADGFARFPGLTEGDYLFGLAASNAAQLVTTSVVPDASARVIATAPGSPMTSLIASPDLKHAWSATANGVLTPVGQEDAGRPVVNLNGRVISVASGQDQAWALVDQGSSQPALYRLDFASGTARVALIQGLITGQRVTGLVQAGNTFYVQLTSGDTNSVAAFQAGQTSIVVGTHVAIPSGTVVGSADSDRIAVLGNRSPFSGEDQQNGARISVVQLRGTTASIQSLDLDDSIANLSYSSDGRMLFATLRAGGIEVLSADGALRSVAQLAEATGPVTAGEDGRFVTGNASKADELIVWDSRTWTPTGRVQLPSSRGSIVGLAVDPFGDRLLAVTAGAALSASLSNPAPQSVSVTREGVTQTTLGVRLVDRPTPLPTRIEIKSTTDEDVPLSFDLSSVSTIREIGTGLFFAPGTSASLGTLLVTPAGRVSYRAQANANGSDSATLRVFDGVSTTTLVISLNVQPVNDAPSSFTVDPVAIDESSSGGQLAGVATVFDVDSDARYAITTNDARFVVIDGQIVLSESGTLDYETEPTIELEITATDLDNPAFVITQRINIPVNDNNEAPTGIGLSSATVTENEESATVGRIVVTDPDGHGQYSYAVSDGRFEVANGELRVRSGATLDYESEPVISLSITVIDSTIAGNNSFTSDVSIAVFDGNDAPTGLMVSGNEVRSGEEGAVVGQISVIDQDATDDYSYGVSDSRFMVDGNVLRLRDGQSLSHDKDSTVSMMVSVTDRGGAVFAETVTVNVTNDSPFQNPRNPLDVDNDGYVYPRDALVLVNQLNQRGSHILTPATASGESTGQVYYLDVNGDGILSPIDALILINHLNQRSTPAINNGKPGGSSKPGPEAQSKVPDPVDPTVDNTKSKPGEGEGEGEGIVISENACQPWIANSIAQERARRLAIDTELELLVDQLSRARIV